MRYAGGGVGHYKIKLNDIHDTEPESTENEESNSEVPQPMSETPSSDIQQVENDNLAPQVAVDDSDPALQIAVDDSDPALQIAIDKDASTSDNEANSDSDSEENGSDGDSSNADLAEDGEGGFVDAEDEEGYAEL